MLLEIVTPDQKVFEGEVNAVTFPGNNGEFQVLNSHAPLISSLGKGAVRIQTTGKNEEITIDGGVVEVLDNKIVVLAESLFE